MLRVAILFLLPTLVAADLLEAQKAAWCAIHCLPPIPYPKTAGDNCLRLVYNASTTQGNGLWSYDRLVFEGPECGTYNFVIKTKSDITMFTVPHPNGHLEKSAENPLPAKNITCLRGCKGGLLEDSCTNPTYSVSRGYVNYGSEQTVHRTFQFGCELKTTIIRAYRPEFEILAELEPLPLRNGVNIYSELWSINRGFLQTVPHHNNVNSHTITVITAEQMARNEKNLRALKCFDYTNPPFTADKTCSRQLVNETVTDKTGKWMYNREVFEGPECGRYTFMITTRGNVSMRIETTPMNYIDKHSLQSTNSSVGDCLRASGFPVCHPTVVSNSRGLIIHENGSTSDAFHHAQYDCDGVKNFIVRSFRDETVVKIDLERDEEPRLYSEKWRIKNGVLITEPAPYGE